MNLAGTRGLPITYILQNNQIALDTAPINQSGVEVWADKASAMGFPSWTIDALTQPLGTLVSLLQENLLSTAGAQLLVHV